MDYVIDTEEKAIAIIIATYNDKKINLLQKARAFSFLYDQYGSIKKIRSISTIDKTSILRYIKINQLPDRIKNLIISGKIKSYHLAAELTRIRDEERQYATAKLVSGLPRTIGREVIRHVLRNKDKKVEECFTEVFNEYKETNIHVLIYNINEIFKEYLWESNNTSIDDIINRIKEKHNINIDMSITVNNGDIIVIIDNDSINKILEVSNSTKPLKEAIRELIIDVIN